MGTARIALVASLALVVGVASAPGRTLEGTVRLLDGDRPSSEVKNAVVYFVPDSPVEVEPATDPPEVVTVRKEFLPRVEVVPVGTTVRFPNQDPILHNVFSVSPGHRFDLGFYPRGEARETTFTQPGVVRIFCNVHHSMVAYVLVLETPYSTSPSPEGRFELALPDGPGTLHVWHERMPPHSQRLRGDETRLEIRQEMSLPRVPKHLNKFGKPYTRSRRGRRYGG